MADLLYLIPLLPLVAFVINIFWGRTYIKGNAHWIAIPAAVGSWILSILVFREIYTEHHAISQRLFTWIPAGDFNITVSLYADQLTAIMLLVVSSIGMLVCVYSVGYMHGEDGYYRFFSYIPLFIFSMLMLVLADNLLTLFIFWEAVGLCSYFLIGYYFKRRSAGNAAKKAFIVNRVGDLAFGIGIMLTYWTFDTIYFHGEEGILEQAYHFADHGISAGTITAIAILLFIGACGKSAQFPLHIWLPDAMEGPTPVSALIHAATMVTAGIYMSARSYTIFISSEDAMLFVSVIGAITAFMAASIALTQHDIKKVVAYSTVSQLGYMALALGTGAWLAAIFHLMTHAFFKGLLFLGSGSVIHGMHGEQDMRKMGGLRKHMPITFWTFLIGSAANAGVFPLAGFWSKDEIIVGAWISDNPFGKIAAIVALMAAFLTALYMFRLVFLVFFGEERFDKHVHPHESGPWMAVPLVILAVASVFVGFVGFPPEDGAFHEFLHHAFEHVHAHHVSMTMTWTFGIVSTVVALSGIAVAYVTYMRKAIDTTALATRFAGLYNFLLNKWFVDEFFMAAIVNPMKDIAQFLWKVVDVRVIDGTVNGVGTGISAASQRLRKTQTGSVANYALEIGIGLVLVLGIFLIAFGNLF
ncbi:MAG: NADH-quinone oxidoreductase subunit L [Thermomicrobiales bacterium]|nr:NADH-quinone oxidoreductase subunit L [Thermomicrobiales bacterium]MCO5226198.1 NADH-quinone oxidoreductase subunit L [Thermomicrobiales bacterium]MCO5228368.1 NADH-quinone oxidoreductase subunit L [Thermomicrobiales bacterium]